MSKAITYDDIVAARKRIAAHIQPLRVTRSESLSHRVRQRSHPRA